MDRPQAVDTRTPHYPRTLLVLVLTVLLSALGACTQLSPVSSSVPDSIATQTTDSVDRDARDSYLAEFFIEDEYSVEDGEAVEEEAETILVTYQVDGDQISSPVEESVDGALVALQDDTQTQEEIWEFFVSFMPADQRKLIGELVIFTDGADNVLAATEQVSEVPEAWSLEIDIADVADKAELTYNLLHEYAHVLTLNETQFATGGNGGATFESEDEPTAAGSYLNLFYQRFWTDISSEWELAYDQDYLDEFYDEHSNEFLTDYAATEPEEDIAESWLYFVVSERPSGDSVADQKIDFFYDFPEMVELREQILDNLYLYLTEGR